jgi:type VII secretion protein EccE
VRTTVLLRIDAAPVDTLPLSTIASYLDRYGIRCSGIRITSCHPERVTWIGLTLSAADNLTALLARSDQVPLHQTAHVAARRLADQLRELGWDVHLVDAEDIPWPAPISERWRGVRVDRGYVAAYQVKVDHSLGERLSRMVASPALATWTALELTGDPAHPVVSAGCARLTADKPARSAPVDGLTPHAGDHGPALAALNPASTEPMHGRRRATSAGFYDGLDALQRFSHVPQVASSA